MCSLSKTRRTVGLPTVLNLDPIFTLNDDVISGREDLPAVLAIGPAPVELMNEVTGKLRLL